MLVVPSLQSFQIYLSQLPLDGVSYSLTSVTENENIVVNLGDAAVQRVSPVLHSFIRTAHGVGYCLFICLPCMCGHCYVHTYVHTYVRVYVLYIRTLS